MSTTVFIRGKRVRLDDRDLLGVGGEGRVFRAGDQAIKVFFAMTDERRQKLAAFPKGLPDSVVGPLDLCTDQNGTVVGYAMRALDGAVDIHRIAQRKWRDANRTLGTADVLGLFRDLGSTVDRLHAQGVVVGDLNDGNVVLTNPWQPWFIDADSMQWGNYPCTVAHERFLDPRLYGFDLDRGGVLSRESDWYALAVMLFSSLLLVHPYGGAHASYPTLLRRAEARHSILRGDVKVPHAARRPDILTDDALAWFTSVFDRDVRAPLPPFILQSRFAQCACGVEHARRACPACTVVVAMPAPVKTLGAIRITRLGREDGRRFIDAELAHDAQVRIEGDWLVRTANSTRIGQILEGQTHVRCGRNLGFAFYRAGAVTMSFLFDTQRGPLRQLELPHIDGKLIDWSVAFDDGHVLFCTTTEKSGRALHTAHLIDARGAILASESGPAGSSAILAGTSGKCLASGAILAPTDDGLVLIRADRASRAFVPIRAFPETRDLVPPDADLLVGPGGSVYVVTHDEIVHLCFERESVIMSSLPIPAFYEATTVRDVYVERVGLIAETAASFKKKHKVLPASQDKLRIAAFGIDCQIGFCAPGASLFVPGAVEDTSRTIEWLYRNLDRITQVAFSLDTHRVFQIFHPAWWVDDDGKHPDPFTSFSLADVREGKWKPIAHPAECLEYVKRLEESGKYVLTVWPYHTLLGGVSHALVPALMEAAMFHALVRQAQTHFETKGTHAMTENYSVLAPEVRELGGKSVGTFNAAFFKMLMEFDRVYVFGQAKSHCVLSTLKDMQQHIAGTDPELMKKIYILEDATSPVPAPPIDPLPPALDFPRIADKAFADLKAAGMNIVKTTDAIA